MSSEAKCAMFLSLEPNDYDRGRICLLEYQLSLQYQRVNCGLASWCNMELARPNSRNLSIQIHQYSKEDRRDTQSYLRANRSNCNALRRKMMTGDHRK